MKNGFFDHKAGSNSVDQVNIKGNVVAVLVDKDGNKRTFTGENIVTYSGDRYYARLAAGEASLFKVNGMRLGLGGAAAPSKTDSDVVLSFTGCGLSIDAGYPQTNDADANNTGRGSNVVTWRTTYSALAFSQAGISEVALTDSTANGSVTQAINRAKFAASFDKTLTDTLTVYVNHTLLGV